jgi:hypothetical protein
MMILGLVHASNSCHTIHHESKDMSRTKHQPSISCTKLCVNHAQHLCTSTMYTTTIQCANHEKQLLTSTMYINTIEYTIRYHQWGVSTI